MKRALVFCLVVFFVFSLKGQIPGFQWAKSFKGHNGISPTSILIDNNKNVITAGQFAGTYDFDPGPGIYTLTAQGLADGFICKLDAAGHFLWAIKVGATSWGSAFITLDSFGDIYATGTGGNYDTFVWKLDGGGNMIWAKTLPGTMIEQGLGISVDPGGNVIISGYIQSPLVDFDPGPGTYTLSGQKDGFILKLDPNGNFVWVRPISKVGQSGMNGWAVVIWSIDTDNAGDIYYAGQFIDTVDFDPGPATYTFAAPTSSDNFNEDGFISKLDASGNFVFAKIIGGPKRDLCKRIMGDNSGNFYVSGSYDSIADLDPGPGSFIANSQVNDRSYMIKIDAAGNTQLIRYVPSNFFGMDPSNNIYMMGNLYGIADMDPGPGTFTLSSNSGSSIFSKMDSGLNLIWAYSLNDTSGCGSGEITGDNAGNVYAVGAFTGTRDFDPGPWVQTISTGSDVCEGFIFKLGPDIVGLSVYGKSEDLNFSPNPTEGEVQISFQNEQSGNLRIFDALGNLLLEKNFLGKATEQINLTDQPAGMYFLECEVDNRLMRSKLLKY